MMLGNLLTAARQSSVARLDNSERRPKVIMADVLGAMRARPAVEASLPSNIRYRAHHALGVTMQKPRSLFLGAAVPPSGGDSSQLLVPPHHLVTHGVVLGMTGSGKTGLLMITVEEALRSG